MISDLHMHPLDHKYYFTMADGFSKIVLDEKDKKRIREVVDWCYHERKLDAIALTDHDMIQASIFALEYVKDAGYNMEVITGLECSVRDHAISIGDDEIHLLCLGINKAPKYNIVTHVDTMIDAVHEIGGVVIMAHPYKYPKTFERYCHLLDGYEYLNSDYPPFDEGREILREKGLVLREFYNSDFHYKGEFPNLPSKRLHTNNYEKNPLFG